MAAVEYWQSPAGRAWAMHGDNRNLRVNDTDGTFVTEDEFRPGDYQLRVSLPTGLRERRITIPEPAEDQTQVDLGDVVLE